MNEVRTRVVVGPDHSISGTAPAEVPAGEHEVTVTLADRQAGEPAARPAIKEICRGTISVPGLLA
jgi:hypothetical protein